ncbi:hypothetical protein V6Z11_A06G100200 [Gossypium hirsutum]
MFLMCALICDVSTDLVLHLVMMDLESPSTIISIKPNSILVSTASKQARAFASKAMPTAVCKQESEARTSLFAFWCHNPRS